MTVYCPECREDTETETMAAVRNPDKFADRVPARVFCADCGWFHGYDETAPEPEVEETLPWPVPAATAPEFGRDSLPAVLDGLSLFPVGVATAIWILHKAGYVLGFRR